MAAKRKIEGPLDPKNPNDQVQAIDMYHHNTSAPTPIKVKIGNNSVYESAKRSMKFKRELLRGRGKKEMTREEMINRLILIKQRYGEISEKHVKEDSILILYEVEKEFGSLEKAKKVVKEEMRSRSHGEKMTKEEFVRQHTTQNTVTTKNQETTTKKYTEVKKEGMVKKQTEQRSRGSFRIDKEQVLMSLVDYAKELGRLPTTAEIIEKSKKEPNFPCYSSVSRKLGSTWQEEVKKVLRDEKAPKIEKEPEEIEKVPEIKAAPEEVEKAPEIKEVPEIEKEPEEIEKVPNADLKPIEDYIEWICSEPHTASAIDISTSYAIHPSEDLTIEITIHATKNG